MRLRAESGERDEPDAAGGPDASAGDPDAAGPDAGGLDAAAADPDAAAGEGEGEGEGDAGIERCDDGRARCPPLCVDLEVDARNCGSCYNVCPAFTRCVEGECSCPYELIVCPDACAELATDERHCGDCSTSCVRGATCLDGSCACPAGATECPDACADLATEESHCGDCVTACLAGATCVGGACACPSGESECPEECADLARDTEHCGECGNACPGEIPCIDGVCTCPPGFTRCTDVCADLQADALHCGACDAACMPGGLCVDGLCECPAGEIECPDGCASLETDRSNCGLCGGSCFGGPCARCENGLCCSPACGDDCWDLATDADHCGSPYRACLNAPCLEGECACEEGEILCERGNDGIVDSGPFYCVDPTYRPTDCGGCHGASDGCNRWLPSDDPHCCGEVEYCDLGQCVCLAGRQPCDDGWGSFFCPDLESSPWNCGACGNECADEELCAQGSCVPCVGVDCADSCPEGLTACGPLEEQPVQCVDLQTDYANCGDCTRICLPGDLCVAGECRGFGHADGCEACPCECQAGSTCCTMPGNAGYVMCVEGETCPE